MTAMPDVVGIHCLLELRGCPGELLDDHDYVLEALREGARRAGATWLGQVSHRFTPQGVTAIGLLAESHITMHTWPEQGFAAVDVFTCGEVAVARIACEHLVAVFNASSHTLSEVERGMLGAHAAVPVKL